MKIKFSKDYLILSIMIGGIVAMILVSALKGMVEDLLRLPISLVSFVLVSIIVDLACGAIDEKGN
jgi:hypothetical protein